MEIRTHPFLSRCTQAKTEISVYAVKIHSGIVNIISYVVKLIILFQDTWKTELDFVCFFFSFPFSTLEVVIFLN